jgi:hypothetical protein
VRRFLRALGSPDGISTLVVLAVLLLALGLGVQIISHP